ncbi:unnamed protein product [Cyclocybe aegerita]|uniref:Uncharacterized protein n=1 Tax=Cyclocybe aegerita TaxID=1973307 RepID=A0A8S0XPX4_CYCAE|nr:unnamed protein product [Cyclocybe aegerita]
MSLTPYGILQLEEPSRALVSKLITRAGPRNYFVLRGDVLVLEFDSRHFSWANSELSNLNEFLPNIKTIGRPSIDERQVTFSVLRAFKSVERLEVYGPGALQKLLAALESDDPCVIPPEEGAHHS